MHPPTRLCQVGTKVGHGCVEAKVHAFLDLVASKVHALFKLVKLQIHAFPQMVEVAFGGDVDPAHPVGAVPSLWWLLVHPVLLRAVGRDGIGRPRSSSSA